MIPITIPGLENTVFILAPTAMIFEVERTNFRFYYTRKTENAVLVDRPSPSLSNSWETPSVGRFMMPREKNELNQILDEWAKNRTIKFMLEGQGDKLIVLSVFK